MKCHHNMTGKICPRTADRGRYLVVQYYSNKLKNRKQMLVLMSVSLIHVLTESDNH